MVLRVHDGPGLISGSAVDSGFTTDVVSQELVCIAGLKVHELAEQVPMQLGTRGSQAKINYGTKACIKYGHVDMQHYFDIVNIDRYDVILGMVFMRKHGIMLDFDKNEIRHKKEVLPALQENPDAYLLVRRQAMRYRDRGQGDDPVKKTKVPKGTDE